MNCVELQKSLAEREDGSRPEQQAHLNTCPECSALVADLNQISFIARELQAAEDPSPQVWNAIKLALRQEGLIRERRPRRSLLPSSLIPPMGSGWAWARWMVPAAALLLFALGFYLRQPQPRQIAGNLNPAAGATAVSDAAIAGLNDDDLLQEVSDQEPALRSQYEDYLRHANQYIQDEKDEVAANPTDEEARRSLLEAYQQKAMLFELALDRSLQ
jgi:hypothetical protein